jgi:hypothetical protein
MPFQRRLLVAVSFVVVFASGYAAGQRQPPAANVGQSQEILRSLDLTGELDSVKGRSLPVRGVVLGRVAGDEDGGDHGVGGDDGKGDFGNLGGDALLVVPCPEDSGRDFSHLASFTKTASPSLQQALWTEVGHALESRIGARPIWLSTAGHGVAWLHVRIDSRPKYYSHAPYREG